MLTPLSIIIGVEVGCGVARDGRSESRVPSYILIFARMDGAEVQRSMQRESEALAQPMLLRRSGMKPRGWPRLCPRKVTHSRSRPRSPDLVQRLFFRFFVFISTPGVLGRQMSVQRILVLQSQIDSQCMLLRLQGRGAAGRHRRTQVHFRGPLQLLLRRLSQFHNLFQRISRASPPA